MAVDLTSDEQKKVDSKAKSNSELPVYFSAVTKLEIPISRDFEAFLILSTSSLKQKAQQWLNRSLKISKEQTDRDNLLKEALVYEVQDTGNVHTELNGELSQFDEFRSQFVPDKFQEVPEVGTLIADLQLAVGELSSLRDRMEFLESYSKLVSKIVEQKGLNSDQARELQSWSASLSAY